MASPGPGSIIQQHRKRMASIPTNDILAGKFNSRPDLLLEKLQGLSTSMTHHAHHAGAAGEKKADASESGNANGGKGPGEVGGKSIETLASWNLAVQRANQSIHGNLNLPSRPESPIGGEIGSIFSSSPKFSNTIIDNLQSLSAKDHLSMRLRIHRLLAIPTAQRIPDNEKALDVLLCHMSSFARLGLLTRRALARGAYLVTARPGKAILCAGNAPLHVYFLLLGTAETVSPASPTQDEDDHHHMSVRVTPASVSAFEPGDMIGELAITAPNAKRTATVVAVTKCTLVCVERNEYIRAFTAHSKEEELFLANLNGQSELNTDKEDDQTTDETKIIQYLRTLPFFDGSDPAMVTKIVRAGTLVKYDQRSQIPLQRGEHLGGESGGNGLGMTDTADRLVYIVLRGRCKVTRRVPVVGKTSVVLDSPMGSARPSLSGVSRRGNFGLPEMLVKESQEPEDNSESVLCGTMLAGGGGGSSSRPLTAKTHDILVMDEIRQQQTLKRPEIELDEISRVPSGVKEEQFGHVAAHLQGAVGATLKGGAGTPSRSSRGRTGSLDDESSHGRHRSASRESITDPVMQIPSPNRSRRPSLNLAGLGSPTSNLSSEESLSGQQQQPSRSGAAAAASSRRGSISLLQMGNREVGSSPSSMAGRRFIRLADEKGPSSPPPIPAPQHIAFEKLELGEIGQGALFPRVRLNKAEVTIKNRTLQQLSPAKTDVIKDTATLEGWRDESLFPIPADMTTDLTASSFSVQALTTAVELWSIPHINLLHLADIATVRRLVDPAHEGLMGIPLRQLQEQYSDSIAWTEHRHTVVSEINQSQPQLHSSGSRRGSLVLL
ncbi:hypothetical protein DFS34DRAFT_598210 [Phlyctochytrium arcticum]|nr:hypothetical protein DFS34DRAFT_598210 [Phlyctochytrium arcticum]